MTNKPKAKNGKLNLKGWWWKFPLVSIALIMVLQAAGVFAPAGSPRPGETLIGTYQLGNGNITIREATDDDGRFADIVAKAKDQVGGEVYILEAKNHEQYGDIGNSLIAIAAAPIDPSGVYVIGTSRSKSNESLFCMDSLRPLAARTAAFCLARRNSDDVGVKKGDVFLLGVEYGERTVLILKPVR